MSSKLKKRKTIKSSIRGLKLYYRDTSVKVKKGSTDFFVLCYKDQTNIFPSRSFALLRNSENLKFDTPVQVKGTIGSWIGVTCKPGIPTTNYDTIILIGKLSTEHGNIS